jgi:hypothetical protein
MRLSPNRLPNQDGQRVRMRGRQAGLRPAAVETSAFLSDLGRYRYGMNVKRQEKNRKKEQQPDDAAASRGAGFHSRRDHNQLSTRVRIGCQSGGPRASPWGFAGRPWGEILSKAPGESRQP